MTFALRYAVRSDVGLLREGNEDSAYAGPHLLAIADGMGGHAAGEVASAVAISALAPLDADTTGLDMLRALADAVTEANTTLHDITQSDPSTEGMGTTLTALLWSGSEVALCHIGDSRAYLLRDGAFYQITHDHTLVQSLVDEGRLTREAAASHPQRSLVMRALQSSIPADPDLTMLQAELGDRYLLCSDGLSDVVSDETLQKTLMQLADLDEAVEQLVDLAIRSGGPDNITCILADVTDTELGPVAPTEQAVIVGAVASGDVPAPQRSDSPAARAHLLTHGWNQAASDGAGAEDDTADGREADRGPDGIAAADAVRNLTWAAARPDGRDTAEDDVPDDTDDDDDEDDDDDGRPAGPRRRRWPVVTFILAVLVGVVGVGGYYGWRITQNQYFVGTADGHVAVFRGVNEPVAGISLFSVVQRTSIPLAAMPATEAEHVRTTIPARNLADAQQIVLRIKRGYQCDLVLAAIGRWTADRPKPPAPVHHGKHTRHGKRGIHALEAPKLPAYPPKPVLPAFCAALSGVTG
ncbi:MAG TPA: PP2C family serine/threonine-protein phosphatase [Streptosporangiaceae bacterium]|nr:PP2C family serine/threonine-protein phosphatase [Streptosporangiaceae bacterium]